MYIFALITISYVECSTSLSGDQDIKSSNKLCSFSVVEKFSFYKFSNGYVCNCLMCYNKTTARVVTYRLSCTSNEKHLTEGVGGLVNSIQMPLKNIFDFLFWDTAMIWAGGVVLDMIFPR